MTKISFTVNNEDKKTEARTGKLKIGSKIVKTPIMFHGTILNGKPEPWVYFREQGKEKNIQGLMINAYEIIKSIKHKQKIFDSNIHAFLNFDGIVFMDSGGYLIQKNQDFEINLEEVVEIYKKTSPDLLASLDLPLGPNQNKTQRKFNIKKSLDNWGLMSQEFNNIMPIIHGYTKEEIKHFCDCLACYDTPVIGIGSLVPLIRSAKKTKKIGIESGFAISNEYTTQQFIIDSIKYVRKRFPDKFLHVFGIGSSSTMHLMFALGVDSIDSMGWRLKAAFGAIQLPKTGDRFILPSPARKNRPKLSKLEIEQFKKCNCGIHENNSLKKINDSFKLRAIHNAYVFMKENHRALNKIANKQYAEFLEINLKNSQYFSLFKYGQRKRKFRQSKILQYL